MDRRLVRKEEHAITGKRDKRGHEPITWHTAFRDVIQLTLYPYRDRLSFEFEHPLNSEPLKIDVVIIKKEGEAVIDSPLAAIFRRVNIVEYKSPGDHLSVGDYHKAGAYARLYSVQNRVETGEMSISFVVEAHPRKLLEYLVKEYGYEVQEEWPGIYYGKGDIFPVQIVESKQLGDWGGVKWLKELRGGLKGEELREIIEMSGSMPKGAPLSAYLYTILRANSRGLKELMAMSDAAFEAVLKEYGFTAKWETEGLEKGREEAVIRLQKYGMEPKQISEALELPLGTVFRYLKAE